VVGQSQLPFLKLFNLELMVSWFWVATLGIAIMLKKMLAQLGIEEERVRLDWVAASEGDCFVSIVNDMIEKVRALGRFKQNSEEAKHD